jgi:pyruvate-ferredoxin/flavodoxin oxidoreductase
MTIGMDIQKDAVACGYWPLYSFDPRIEEHPFVLASKKPTGSYKDFALKEGRFNILSRSKPEESAKLLELGQADILKRYHYYEQLADVSRMSAAEAAAAVANGGNGDTKESKETK